MSKSKIFGIGLAKTGTTSLNDAFAILGIASIGCPADIASIRRFDAATDGIVADRFEELDRVADGSVTSAGYLARMHSVEGGIENHVYSERPRDEVFSRVLTIRCKSPE